CFDIQLDTMLIEAKATLGGQLPEIGHSVRNVAAGRFADGRALQGSLLEAADILAGRVRLSHPVSRADLTERVIEAGGERIAGRAVVLATGTRRQFLEAAPDGAFDGDVTYQVEPRLDGFAGRDVAVIGGGDSGSLDALALARRGSAVTLIHRSPDLTARDDIVRQLRDEPRITDLAGWDLEATREQSGSRASSSSTIRPDNERISPFKDWSSRSHAYPTRSCSGRSSSSPDRARSWSTGSSVPRALECSPPGMWSPVRTLASPPRWDKVRWRHGRCCRTWKDGREPRRRTFPRGSPADARGRGRAPARRARPGAPIGAWSARARRRSPAQQPRAVEPREPIARCRCRRRGRRADEAGDRRAERSA